VSTQPPVAMYAPDGTLGQVPYEQAQAAIKAGGKVAVKMQAPDGTLGYVPTDRTGEAQKAGGKIIPIDSAPAEQPKEGFLAGAGNELSGMAKGVGQALQSSPTDFGNIAQQASSGALADVQRQQEGRSVPYRTVAALAPVAGVNPQGMEAAANAGDPGGVLGHAAGAAVPAVGSAALHAAGEAIPAARGAIGDAIHTPEGALGPGAKTVGSVVGGTAGTAVGTAVGHPYAGGVLGYKAGPALLGKLFPESAETVAARNDFLQAKTITEAQEKAIAMNAVKDARAARAKSQAAAQNSVSDLAGSPDDLITRTQRIVVPGETPTVADLKRAGDLTQAPLSRLQQLAKFGDRLAQNEINRRLKNP
jgi:hypothetical protein